MAWPVSGNKEGFGLHTTDLARLKTAFQRSAEVAFVANWPKRRGNKFEMSPK